MFKKKLILKSQEENSSKAFQPQISKHLIKSKTTIPPFTGKSRGITDLSRVSTEMEKSQKQNPFSKCSKMVFQTIEHRIRMNIPVYIYIYIHTYIHIHTHREYC